MARATSAGCASARRSARRSSRPASSNSQIASMTRAVSSISAPERLEEARHDRLPERVPRGLADPGLPVAQADHGLRHRAVAPGAADVAERAAHHVTRGAHVAHVAHADVELAVHGAGHDGPRSEEHTSELQSPCNLVCRLLLEKKKKKKQNNINKSS